ncbi:MAG: UraA [Gammaproteobacteria bacterium]|jgi:NCS2 family nucleobase:cation symporter-2|nr:UraA [Gammaproteobacteria bacterium]
MDASDLIYNADQKPPFFSCIMLGLQHCLGMASTLVLPLMIFSAIGISGGKEAALISGSMFAVGFGTLLMCLKSRFVGTGFLCPVLCEPAFLIVSLSAIQIGGPDLLFGMVLIAAIFQVIFALLYPLIRFLFPTEVSGIVVLMVGLSLVKPDLIYSTGSSSLNAIHLASSELITASVTLAVMICVLIWGKASSRYSMLLGVLAGLAAATWQGVLLPSDFQKVLNAPYFSWNIGFALPHMKFDFSLALSFAIASIAMLLKGVGGIISCQKVNSTSWEHPEQNNIRKMLFTNGLSNVFASIIGGISLGVANNNIALSCATGITSRYVGIIAGVTMMLFALLPKITMLFVIMPKAIIGATMLFVTSYIIVSGIQILSTANIDTRKIFIIGLSLVAGLVVEMHPENFPKLPAALRNISEAPIIMTTLTAIILNLLFSIGRSQLASLKINPTNLDQAKLENFLNERWHRWHVSTAIKQHAPNIIYKFLQELAAQHIQGEVLLQLSYTEYQLTISFIYAGSIIDTQICDTENQQPLSNTKLALQQAKASFTDLKTYSSQNTKTQTCKAQINLVQ